MRDPHDLTTGMMPPLITLAERINAAHRACEVAASSAVRHAIEAGRLLLEAKTQLPHGAWLGWLAEHVECSVRTAQLYMQLAREWDAGELDPQRVAYVPLRDLAREVATARMPTVEPSEMVTSPMPPVEPGAEWHDGDEWYTPAAYLEAARRLLGGIDLDPASCPVAQALVRATRFHTKDDDGLAQVWRGRVWLNPPYSLVEAFADKVVCEYDQGRVTQAVLLANASTDTRWFASLAERFPVLFTRGRIRFWSPDRAGEQPRYGQALFGLGVDPSTFAQAFGSLAYAPNVQSLGELVGTSAWHT